MCHSQSPDPKHHESDTVVVDEIYWENTVLRSSEEAEMLLHDITKEYHAPDNPKGNDRTGIPGPETPRESQRKVKEYDAASM